MFYKVEYQKRVHQEVKKIFWVLFPEQGLAVREEQIRLYHISVYPQGDCKVGVIPHYRIKKIIVRKNVNTLTFAGSGKIYQVGTQVDRYME